jgi:paraquat-inducible protein A
MKIENEEALDEYILCPKCLSLHKETPIADGSYASCSVCEGVLYYYNTDLIDRGLALSLTGVILFGVVNFFPLVEIELLGLGQSLTIAKTIGSLFESGFYLVGILSAFLIFIFPLMILLIYLLLFTLLKFRRGVALSGDLLVLLAHIVPWSMVDIFLVSILVALVKLIGYAQIVMGTAFWALIAFVVVEVLLVKRITIAELWLLRKRCIVQRRDD